MFFKKKKNMSDNTTNQNQNEDNLSQNGAIDEALSNVLNTDDSRSGDQYLNEGEDEEIEKLQAELIEMKDKHLRMVAEFDNFRRRNAKERMEMAQTAGKDIIESLL